MRKIRSRHCQYDYPCLCTGLGSSVRLGAAFAFEFPITQDTAADLSLANMLRNEEPELEVDSA